MTKYKSFILSHSLFNQLKGRKQLRSCKGCRKEFKVNDQIISVQGKKAKWYCFKCAVKYGII